MFAVRDRSERDVERFDTVHCFFIRVSTKFSSSTSQYTFTEEVNK